VRPTPTVGTKTGSTPSARPFLPTSTLAHLKPHHVQKWVDAQENLASGSRRNLIAAAKRALKWAEEQGYVERSPLAHLRKPGCGRKEQVVSSAEYQGAT